MIKAVLFDLDRTLLDRDTAFRNFVVSQQRKFADALSGIPAAVFIERVILLDKHGLLWKDEVYQAIVREFGIASLRWEELFEDFALRVADYYMPFPGLREMLDTLKSRGYLLGLVTNGREAFQKQSIRALGLDRDFQAVLISEVEGVRKPEPDIFCRALSRLSCQPQEAVFVGDSVEADILGAKRVGMFTAWKRDPLFLDPVDADIVFDDLGELPGAIDGLSIP